MYLTHVGVHEVHPKHDCRAAACDVGFTGLQTVNRGVSIVYRQRDYPCYDAIDTHAQDFVSNPASIRTVRSLTTGYSKCWLVSVCV